jgi:hypothetical protein
MSALYDSMGINVVLFEKNNFFVSLFKRRLSKGNGDEQEEFVLPFSATTNS